jgi:hypothetical protein
MILNEYFKNIYYINLKHRYDRLSDTVQEFKSLNIIAKRFEGILALRDGKGYNAFSFLELIKKAKSEGMKNIVIFEDDVQFINHSDFYPVIESFYEFAKNNPWDMFYLGYNAHTPLEHINKNICEVHDCFALHAVIWNHTSFDYIIDVTDKILNDPDFIIDVFVKDEIQTKARCYGALPILAIQRKSFSDIENKIVDYGFIMDRYNKFVKK